MDEDEGCVVRLVKFVGVFVIFWGLSIGESIVECAFRLAYLCEIVARPDQTMVNRQMDGIVGR